MLLVRGLGLVLLVLLSCAVVVALYQSEVLFSSLPGTAQQSSEKKRTAGPSPLLSATTHDAANSTTHKLTRVRRSFTGRRLSDFGPPAFVPLQRRHRRTIICPSRRWVVIPGLRRSTLERALSEDNSSNGRFTRRVYAALTRAAVRSSRLSHLRTWCVVVVLDGVDMPHEEEGGMWEAEEKDGEGGGGMPSVLRYLGITEQRELASDVVRLALAHHTSSSSSSSTSPSYDPVQAGLRNIGYAWALARGATMVFDLADLTHNIARRSGGGGGTATKTAATGADGEGGGPSLFESVLSSTNPEMPHPSLHNMLLFRPPPSVLLPTESPSIFLFNPYQTMLRLLSPTRSPEHPVFKDSTAPIRTTLRPRGTPVQLAMSHEFRIVSAPTGRPRDDDVESPEAEGISLCDGGGKTNADPLWSTNGPHPFWRNEQGAFTPPVQRRSYAESHRVADQTCVANVRRDGGDSKVESKVMQDKQDPTQWFAMIKRHGPVTDTAHGVRSNDSSIVKQYHAARRRKRRFTRYENDRQQAREEAGKTKEEEAGKEAGDAGDTDTCALRSTGRVLVHQFMVSGELGADVAGNYAKTFPNAAQFLLDTVSPRADEMVRLAI